MSTHEDILREKSAFSFVGVAFAFKVVKSLQDKLEGKKRDKESEDIDRNLRKYFKFLAKQRDDEQKVKEEVETGILKSFGTSLIDFLKDSLWTYTKKVLYEAASFAWRALRCVGFFLFRIFTRSLLFIVSNLARFAITPVGLGTLAVLGVGYVGYKFIYSGNQTQINESEEPSTGTPKRGTKSRLEGAANRASNFVVDVYSKDKNAILSLIAAAESKYEIWVQSTRSSATGLFQFTTGSVSKKTGKFNEGAFQAVRRALGENITVEQFRKDVKAQIRFASYLYDSIEKTLVKNNLPVNLENVYTLWFAGESGGVKLLKSDPNSPVESVLGKDAVNSNPELLKNKTVGQALRNLKRAVVENGGEVIRRTGKSIDVQAGEIVGVATQMPEPRSSVSVSAAPPEPEKPKESKRQNKSFNGVISPTSQNKGSKSVSNPISQPPPQEFVKSKGKIIQVQ